MAMKRTTAARRQIRFATASRQVMSVLAWGRGRRLAKLELPALERQLASASREDRAALLPAQTMYRRGDLTLCGYAAALWERLEAHEPLEAYYSASGEYANLWDGVQRLEAMQWNILSGDLWAAWADDDGLPEQPAHGESEEAGRP